MQIGNFDSNTFLGLYPATTYFLSRQRKIQTHTSGIWLSWDLDSARGFKTLLFIYLSIHIKKERPEKSVPHWAEMRKVVF